MNDEYDDEDDDEYDDVIVFVNGPQYKSIHIT